MQSNLITKQSPSALSSIHYVITCALQLIQTLLPLLRVLCPFGQRIVHVLVDRIDSVSTDEGVSAKTPAVHCSYCQRRSIKLLLGKLQFHKFDRRVEVRIFLCVRYDRRIENVTGAFDVHARLVNGQKMNPLQITQTPKEHLDSTKNL